MLIVDQNTTPGHLVWGSNEADYITSNGTADTIIFGFGGDDTINPGINLSGKLEQIYGGWSLDKFGNPPIVVGTRAQLDNDGNDTLHIGMDIWGKGGSGADTIEVHAFSPKGEHAAAAWLDFFEGDTLIIDNSRKTKAAPDGIDVYDFEFQHINNADGTHRVNADGSMTLIIKEIDIVGQSLKPGFDQAMRMIFDDDGRGQFHELRLNYHGYSAMDEVEAYVHGLVVNHDII